MANLFRSTAQASAYAKFRPHPPKQLIDAVLEYLSQRIPPAQWRLAVDVGCGSGQATQPLAKHFKNVYGFDASKSQIDEAINSNNMPNISFKVSAAETLPIETQSVQLLSACQSVHWFDLQKFFKEVDRVLVPNGVIALFVYTMPDVSNRVIQDERVKNLCKKFYKSPLLVWSKEERQMVDEGYASITLPFADQIRRDDFETVIDVTAEEMKGYLLSWSGFNTLLNEDKESADKFLNSFVLEVKDIFGNLRLSQIMLKLHFKYYLLMGRKHN